MNYSQILSKISLPAAFIDLNAFDKNVATLAQLVQPSGLSIRVATKSIRAVELIRRVLNFGAPYKGLMCYTAQEALFLAENGFDDLLVAYPTLQESDLRALQKIHESGKKIMLVVDSIQHLEKL